jgi:transcriptional regulator with XRE-family HTH domain
VSPITVIGDFLRKLRGKRSLRDIQEVSGVSYTYLRSIEKGVDPRSGNEISPTPDTLRKLAKAYNYPYLELAEMAGIIEEGDKKRAIDVKEYLDVIAFCELIVRQIVGYQNLDFLNDLKIKYNRILGDNFEFTQESIRKLGQELNNSGTYEEVLEFINLYDDIIRYCADKRTGYYDNDLYYAVTDPLATYKDIELSDSEKKEIENFIEYLIHKRN